MFKERTVFVIGAGASDEFGLPVGRTLSSTISQASRFRFNHNQLSEGNYEIFRALSRRYPAQREKNERLLASAKIADGIFMTSSIDNYIDIHASVPHVAEMGKMQIAVAIAAAERASKMYFDTNVGHPQMDLADLSQTWIDSFARILIEKVGLDKVDSLGEHVSIICFNYDRCIEYYLIEVIRRTFDGVDYARAHGIVARMKIIHPYGYLGPLPPSLSGNGNGTLRFGHTLNDGLDPWPVAERLKTYSEQVDEPEVMEEIFGLVDMADHIVFLGFAFHPQNMALLRLGKKNKFKHVYATGMGISRQEVPEVTNRIVNVYGEGGEDSRWRENIFIEQNVGCAEFFRLHWRNLSAA